MNSFWKLEGQWHDVFYNSKKIRCVHGINEQMIIDKIMPDLINLGYSNKEKLFITPVMGGDVPK